MAKVYYDEDADIDAIRRRRIAVIGYGSQGHAHAQNLRDSGCDVRVGLYEGSGSWKRAAADGFVVQTVAEVSEWADLISILLPDQLHKSVYENSIKPNLGPGKLLMTAHGFSIHFGQIVPTEEIDVAMVAPKGPGHMVRRLYFDCPGGVMSSISATSASVLSGGAASHASRPFRSAASSGAWRSTSNSSPRTARPGRRSP